LLARSRFSIGLPRRGDRLFDIVGQSDLTHNDCFLAQLRHFHYLDARV